MSRFDNMVDNLDVYSPYSRAGQHNMQEMGFYVRLMVSDSMDHKQVQAELKTSIGFGSAEVELQYVLPDQETPDK